MRALPVEAALSLLLLLLASSASALRSALLALGEEGLAERAHRDRHAAALLAAVTRPGSRHPFGLFALALLCRLLSALLAGAAASAVASLPGPPAAPAGGATATGTAWLLLAFLLEHLASRGPRGGPDRLLARAGAAAPLLVAAGGRAGALLDGAGRLLFGGDWTPEGLVDVRPRSEEGILDVIEEGAGHGVIDAAEERMIEGVLRFGETTAAGAMTHRSDVVFLREGTALPDLLRAVGEAGRARFPVLSPDGESVTGILAARSLFRLPPGERWEACLEKPLYVPESTKVTDLLRLFRRAEGRLAVVIDEHGTLRGIITLQDLVDRILGVPGGEREAGEGPEWRGDGSLSAPGATPVRVLREEYGVRIPEGGAYETAAGYALCRLQAIPAGPAAFRSDGYVVTVEEVERYRVRAVRFERLPAEGLTRTP